MVFDVLTRLDDADKSTNTTDVPFSFYPCLAAGLGVLHINETCARQNTAFKSRYEEEFERALAEDEIEHLLK